MSCGYQGHHFGAWYEDATCIDGYLWDLDSCDHDNMLTHGGDIPCPACNTAKYVADFPVSGNSKQRRQARRKLIRQVLAWAVGKCLMIKTEKGGA